ncbi:hypothetical protein FD755_025344 [Muntiacus reevesi]|uniref:Kruppel-like factor 8 n=1 Tax=Muntiacus reevesi TaxID=9886 RepID=A0A5N3UNB3_MUNRE|nr:hypothetical protein FD755_025344 [Muntiacus reevesi]
MWAASLIMVTGPVQIRDSLKRADRDNMTSPPLLDANPMKNPALLNDIKIEPPEELLANDFNLPQVEPVDLSFHKPKAPLQPASMLQSPIRPPKPQPASQTLVVSTSTSDTGSSASIRTVLTPGSILASSQGTGGHQILHVIHTIPSVNLPNKMGSLKAIPVVVQSLPMVYTTLPADGNPAAITVPLIGGDGKNTYLPPSIPFLNIVSPIYFPITLSSLKFCHLSCVPPHLVSIILHIIFYMPVSQVYGHSSQLNCKLLEDKTILCFFFWMFSFRKDFGKLDYSQRRKIKMVRGLKLMSERS